MKKSRFNTMFHRLWLKHTDGDIYHPPFQFNMTSGDLKAFRDEMFKELFK